MGEINSNIVDSIDVESTYLEMLHLALSRHVLSPGRYVRLPEEDDDFDFAEKFTGLKAEYEKQLKEEERLNKRISENLTRVEYE